MDAAQMGIIRTNGWSVFNKKKLLIIHGAFFLLFPGYFFYQTLLGVGVIDAFLGGYFSVVSIALMLPLAFFYLLDIHRIKNYFSSTDFYFFLFIAFFFLIVVIHFFAGSDGVLVGDHLSTMLHMVNLFIIIKTLDFHEKFFRIMVMSSLIGMSVIVFYFSVGGFFDLKDDAVKNVEMIATYQGFARSYLLTFIVAVVFFRSAALRFSLYGLAVATLFTNGARSEFAALLALIPVIELYYARNKLLGFLVVSAVLLLVGVMFDDIVSSLPANRILELADLSKSSSASTRQTLTAMALNTISLSPILGDYGSYATGTYAHNVLSAWVDLGLVGFIFLLTILLVPAFQLLSNGFFKKHQSSEFLMAAALIFITILLLLTSHHFADMLIGAALGAHARYRYGKTVDRESTRSMMRVFQENGRVAG